MRTALTFLLIFIASTAAAQALVVREVMIRPQPVLSRPAVQIDEVERQRDREGRVADPDVEHGWVRVAASDGDWIVDDALPGAWAFGTVQVPEAGTYFLEGMGYAGVYVGGEPRIGNVYGYTDDWAPWQPAFDFSLVPVHLEAGENELLFFGNRYGVMRARLRRAETALSLNARDVTLPDLVVGEAADAPGAIVVLNATDQPVVDGVLVAELAGASPTSTPIGVIPPFGLRKAGFSIAGGASAESGTRALHVRVERAGAVLDDATLELAVKHPDENRRVTFVSALDQSVQYYGFLPASAPGHDKALVLSLHGAAVEAINQSGSYAALPWGHIVAPTNRRPFGFSWEDWGRLDALEVLDLAQARLKTDPDRIYLTGHSMGGHGSWHLATLYPDRFAAVGPSAGWISLWSYRMDPPTDVPSPTVALVERATLASRTLEMAPNLAGLGVYVLHGDADDNVPVGQAHLILDRLAGFHRDFEVHVEPGAGHWWDRSDDPGADCVAWAPMFDFFVRHRRPAPGELRSIRFRTPTPSVSARYEWACIAGQQRQFAMSTIALERDPTGSIVRGETGNVSLLGLDFGGVRADSVRIELDGETLRAARTEDGMLWLARDGAWRLAAAPDPAHKGPDRYGSFREAFANRVQFVYATGGNQEENAWALAKARYDAELLWYRGNSSVDVIADTAFDPSAEPDRNVILYGNATTHRGWAALWNGPVSVERGRAVVGAREFDGDGFGVLAVRPRPGSSRALVGIVAPTGPPAARLLERRPVLTPGVAYPDVTVFEDRTEDPIVVGAGWFGPDWSMRGAEFEWADPR